jgi:hypothetical protein
LCLAVSGHVRLFTVIRALYAPWRPAPCGGVPEVAMPCCCLRIMDDLARWESCGMPSAWHSPATRCLGAAWCRRSHVVTAPARITPSTHKLLLIATTPGRAFSRGARPTPTDHLPMLAPGTPTPNPLILGPWSWLFVDSTGYLRLSRLRTLIACGRFWLSGWVL